MTFSDADDQIAVHGRRDKDAFAEFRRLRKDRVGNMSTGFFVQQTVIAAPRCDPDLVFTDHIVNDIGIDAGGVDDVSRFVFTVVGAQMPDAFRIAADIFDMCIETEFHTVFEGVFSHCDIEYERTDDAACRRV